MSSLSVIVRFEIIGSSDHLSWIELLLLFCCVVAVAAVCGVGLGGRLPTSEDLEQLI